MLSNFFHSVSAVPAVPRRTLLRFTLAAPLLVLVYSKDAQARKLKASEYTMQTDSQGAFWVILHGVHCGKALANGTYKIKIHCVKKDTAWEECTLKDGNGKSRERTLADYGKVTGVEIDC